MSPAKKGSARIFVFRFCKFLLLAPLLLLLSPLLLLSYPGFLLTIFHALIVLHLQEIPEYRPNIVTVQFEPGVIALNTDLRTGLQEFDRKIERYEAKSIERLLPFLDHVSPTPQTRQNLQALRWTYHIEYASDISPVQVADDLDSTPGVVYAEPWTIYRVQSLRHDTVPNDLRDNQSYLQHLRLPEAWEFVKGEEGLPRVVVAIVDNGGEWQHEDLRANVWTNSGEIAGNGVDDDFNGFVDDVHGVNFHDPDSSDPMWASDTRLPNHHGTPVAGAVGAVTDNGLGIAGAAWNVDLMHINVACSRGYYMCYPYQGILYAAANGADIINASWGGWVNSARVRLMNQVLDLATDMGTLIVAAAGNDSRSSGYYSHYSHYPSDYPRVLSVGATERDTRRLAPFSNYGRTVDVYAPGMFIRTTAVNNGYAYSAGTSLAAPLVSGVAALVKTRYPDISPDRLHEYIRVTSENMELGNGFVNALAAVRVPPSSPSIWLKSWTWEGKNGVGGKIASGDRVLIKAEFENYLANAQQLRVGLAGTEQYPFLNWEASEASVGFLGTGNLTQVEFGFSVAADASSDQQVRIHVHVQDGAFADSVGMLSFTVNNSVPVLHRTLSALYRHTNGDQWTSKSGWDIKTEPSSVQDFKYWSGLRFIGGKLIAIDLKSNNLRGTLPDQLGNLPDLRYLWLDGNHLRGRLPRSFLKLQNLYEISLPDGVCVPQDDAFQEWLDRIRWRSPSPSGLRVSICD